MPAHLFDIVTKVIDKLGGEHIAPKALLPLPKANLHADFSSLIPQSILKHPKRVVENRTSALDAIIDKFRTERVWVSLFIFLRERIGRGAPADRLLLVVYLHGEFVGREGEGVGGGHAAAACADDQDAFLGFAIAVSIVAAGGWLCSGGGIGIGWRGRLDLRGGGGG